MKQYLQKIRHFIKNVQSIIRFRLINFLSLEQGIMFRAANLIAAEKVEGDYLEFGVYTGGSFIEAFNTIQRAFGPLQKIHGERTLEDIKELSRLWSKMRFFAFDSFQGLPDIEGIDKHGKDFAKGKYHCSEKDFLKNLSNAGVLMEKVNVVSGWYEKTCVKETRDKLSLEYAAIIHIDCDLYTSTKIALKFIEPLLTDGTIIIFDDWFCFKGNPNLGEQKAFWEWQAEIVDWIFVEYQKIGPWTNSFIATKRILN